MRFAGSRSAGRHVAQACSRRRLIPANPAHPRCIARGSRYDAPVADLFLIRHGQARYGEADYDRLSERGATQARHLAPVLREAAPTRVFTGPLRRQVETYACARAAAAEAGVALPEPEVLPELAEYPAFELIAGLRPRLGEVPELASLLSGEVPLDARARERAFEAMIFRWASGEWNVPGVETAAEFAARVERGLLRVMAAGERGQRVAAATSAGPIAVAIGLTLGAGPERMIALSRVVQNASLSILRFKSGAPSFGATATSTYRFNQIHHLPQELVTDR